MIENVITAKNWIAGEWRDGDGNDISRHNPFNDDLVTNVRAATISQADAAVAAASAARRDWAAAPALARTKAMHHAGDLLHARRDEVARVMTREMGKTLAESYEDIEYGVDDLKMAGDDALRLLGQFVQGTSSDTIDPKRVIVQNVPVGVVGLATPWNFPIAIPCELLGPSLASGNTVVWKPSELAPGTGHLLAEVLAQAFPPGVVNVLHGRGDVGAHLVTHPKVDMFGFVGSTATGEAIARAAGVKKLLLELGGNGPVVVLEDADIDAAAEATVYSAYYTSGQVCTATERVLVHESVHDRFVERVTVLSKRVVGGDPLDERTTMGPMCFPGSFDKTRAHLEDAVAKGATIVFGGGHHGLYHEPTVITGVTSDMAIAQDETFGPVVPIMRFSSIEQAIDVANETPYGLQAAVFTESVSKAWQLAEAIDCGTVHVNGTTNHWELLAPFGGMKKSGIGRILGVSSPVAFTNQKQITFDVSK
ncbi:aldehyde dehydrogenase [Mycolicibacterium sp. P9-64]|uniref:aldehyde dehydrogenase family protein n=1 Tax=Mycolicibacterium sp. P9-64 TaxID=2024612 RepID=UPI0011F06E72|nr:aldehyde dehydrogenase family protein [Mycolicibacterium sp. P9-64]KAA0084561.1 aldehyde dehydrogenase [Mycolicibacterium sp. P9-64]